MGLDTSHDCWHGPYSQFMRWRTWLAAQIGYPIGLSEGFRDSILDEGDLPKIDALMPLGLGEPFVTARACLRDLALGGGYIKYDVIAHPLKPLLTHSDCDGRLRWWECRDIAIGLLHVLRSMKNDAKPGAPDRGCYDGMYNATKRFAIGCLKAYRAKEDVIFH